jgi:hypothetical protein
MEKFNTLQAEMCHQTEIKNKKFNGIENEIENIYTEMDHQTHIKNNQFNEIHTEVNERFNTIQTNIQYLQEDMQYQLLELKNNETNVKNNIVTTLKNINDIINYIDNHQINELIEQELKENRNSYKYSYAYTMCGITQTIWINEELFNVLLKYFKSQCLHETHFQLFGMHILIKDFTDDLLKMQVQYKKNEYSMKLPAVHELIKGYNTTQQREQFQRGRISNNNMNMDVLNLNIKMIGETDDEYELRILRFCLERVQCVYWYYKCSEKLFY